VETPSWAKPLQRLSDDDPDVKAFRLRDENTRGTDRYQKAYGNDGVKRSSDGRIIAKTTLREDADRPRPKRDDDRGYSPDREFGVRSAEEAEKITRFEQDRANDGAAAAEASPPPAPAEQPVTLPNSIE
jgi:hypothetical protein